MSYTQPHDFAPQNYNRFFFSKLSSLITVQQIWNKIKPSSLLEHRGTISIVKSFNMEQRAKNIAKALWPEIEKLSGADYVSVGQDSNPDKNGAGKESRPTI
jgi:hypothetical protein